MPRRRRILWLTAAVPGALLILLLGVLAVAQTGFGKRQIAGLIESAASSPDMRIAIEGLDGFVPSHMRLAGLSVADRDGVWLQARDIELQWSPLALLGRTLRIDRLHAAGVDVLRQPVPAQADDDSPSGDGGMALEIDLRSAGVGQLLLGEKLAGEDMLWRLAAEARVAGLDQPNRLILKAERSDGGDGMLDLDGRYDGASQVLAIKLRARESGPALERLPGGAPEGGVTMDADIAGPLDDLTGTFNVTAGNLLSARGDLRATRAGDAVRATLALRGTAGRLGDADWADAVEGAWTLEASGTIDAATITIERAALAAPSGSAALSGTIDRREDTGDLQFDVEAGPDRLFARLLPGISWERLAGAGRLTGKLVQPTIKARIDGAGLQVEEIAVATAAMQIDGSRGADDSLEGKLDARLAGVTLPTADGRVLVTDATVAAAGRRNADGIVELSAVRIASPLLNAEGAGRLDPGRGEVSGNATGQAPDLAAFADALELDIAGALEFSVAARPQGALTGFSVDVKLAGGRAPDVPPALLAPAVTGSLRGAIGPQQAWRIDELAVQSGAGTFGASGQGIGKSGKAALRWNLTELAAFDPQLAGKAEGTAELEGSLESVTGRLRTVLSEARIGIADVPRLALDVEARHTAGETSGTLAIDGEIQNAPIDGRGDFFVAADGRARSDRFDLRWASLTAEAADFRIGPDGTTGGMRVQIGRLEDLNVFIGNRLTGSLDARVEAKSPDRLEVAGTLQSFRLDDSVAVDRAQLTGSVTDPLGKATFDATVAASGGALAGPLRQINLKATGERNAFSVTADGSGDKTKVSVQARVAQGGDATTIDLQSLAGSYSGINIALAGPGRVSVSGETVAIERIALRAGSGSITANGTLGPQQSKLDIQGRAIPLSLLTAIDPELQVTGTLNFAAAVSGALSQPTTDLTIDATDIRLRTIQTAGLPAATLRAKASLRGNAATFDATVAAGQDNTLRLVGAGPLPGPDGVREGRVEIDGSMQLARLTPFLAGAGRVGGRLVTDLTLTANGGVIGGSGTVEIRQGRYFNAAQGIAIRDIAAVIGVVGDRLEFRQFSARTRGDGTFTVSGGVQIDLAMTLPVDIRLVATRARLLDRRDIQATVSSDLRLNGSLAQGLTLGGSATIERAELNLDADVKDGPNIVDLQVREINRPGGLPDDKRQAAAAPGPQVALAIKLNAPQSVFVRGRGLDVEMGGALDIGGTLSRPQILGALQVRRGTFEGIGRRLEFTRGTVTFPDPDRLDPVIDFVAATRIESGSVEISIAGRPSSPSVTFSSQPPLPQDEIMAQLLFGRSTSTLSPLQMAEIGQSIGSLSGLTGSGGGVLDRLRKALGFDRLGVSSDPNAAAGSSPLSGSSLELGRNVAPGVYLGAKQGAEPGSSTAVVEIEVTPNVKVESELGADARSRVGISVEWDY